MRISCAGYLSPTGLYPVRRKCRYPWDVHVISRDIWGLLWDIRTSRQDILRTSQGYPFAVRVSSRFLYLDTSDASTQNPNALEKLATQGVSDDFVAQAHSCFDLERHSSLELANDQVNFEIARRSFENFTRRRSPTIKKKKLGIWNRNAKENKRRNYRASIFGFLRIVQER